MDAKNILTEKIEKYLKIPISDFKTGNFSELIVKHKNAEIGAVDYNGTNITQTYPQKMNFKWYMVFELNKTTIIPKTEKLLGTDNLNFKHGLGRTLIITEKDSNGFEVDKFTIEWFHDGEEWQVIKL